MYYAQCRRDCKTVNACTLMSLKMQNKYTDFTRLYSKATTDEARAAVGLKFMTQLELLPFSKEDELDRLKTTEATVKYRRDGNCLFKKNNDKALRLYSKSIANAPYPISDEISSEELTLAFANRSAVHFHMEKYEACLSDIKQALVFDYPNYLEYKLLERQANCFWKLDKKSDASNSAQKAIDCVPMAKYLPEQLKQRFIDKMNILVHPDADNCDVGSSESCGIPDRVPVPEVYCGPNPNIPSAGNCLEIQQHPVMGRHVVATKDIDPGEILVAEKVFASILYPKKCWTYCNYCMQRSGTLIPCKYCNCAMFCSNKCRVSAWDEYHNIECRVVSELKPYDVADITMLPLRALLLLCNRNQGLNGLYHLVKAVQANKDTSRINGFDENGQYTSTGYLQIHHLFRLFPPKKEFKTHLKHVVGVMCIVNALEVYSNFFSSQIVVDGNALSLSDAKTFVGGLLLKLIETDLMYVHEHIPDLTSSDLPTISEVEIGKGFGPVFFLFNHSCDPNVLSIWNGNTVLLASTRSIAKGEGIFLTYGQHFSVGPKAVRPIYLSSLFDCKCQACVNDWPMEYELVEKNVSVVICEGCKCPLQRGSNIVTCQGCGKSCNVSGYQSLVNSITSKVGLLNPKSTSTEDPIPECAGYIKELNTILQRPNAISLKCEHLLKLFLKMRKGYRKPSHAPVTGTD